MCVDAPVKAGVWSVAAAPRHVSPTGGSPMAYDSTRQAPEPWNRDLAYTHHTRPLLSCQALWLFAGRLWRLDLLDLQESQVQPGGVGGKAENTIQGWTLLRRSET